MSEDTSTNVEIDIFFSHYKLHDIAYHYTPFTGSTENKDMAGLRSNAHRKLIMIPSLLLDHAIYRCVNCE